MPFVVSGIFYSKIIIFSNKPYYSIALYPIPIDCEARVPESGKYMT